LRFYLRSEDRRNSDRNRRGCIRVIGDRPHRLGWPDDISLRSSTRRSSRTRSNLRLNLRGRAQLRGGAGRRSRAPRPGAWRRPSQRRVNWLSMTSMKWPVAAAQLLTVDNGPDPDSRHPAPAAKSQHQQTFCSGSPAYAELVFMDRLWPRLSARTILRMRSRIQFHTAGGPAGTVPRAEGSALPQREFVSALVPGADGAHSPPIAGLAPLGRTSFAVMGAWHGLGVGRGLCGRRPPVARTARCPIAIGAGGGSPFAALWDRHPLAPTDHRRERRRASLALGARLESVHAIPSGRLRGRCLCSAVPCLAMAWVAGDAG